MRLLAGDVEMEDLRITPAALRMQAESRATRASDACPRTSNARAELVDVPQDFIMKVYELLRPGRAKSKRSSSRRRRSCARHYGAERIARFIEEAAEIYERRGLFTFRF